MGKTKLFGAMIATATIASSYSGAFALDAAHQEGTTIGVVKGTWLSKCEGTPKRLGRCSEAQRHCRCFQVKNPLREQVNCNLGMTANMKSDDGWDRSYTATQSTTMLGGDNDWLCFSYDGLLAGEGGPDSWRVQNIEEPEVSCSKQGREPPCSKQQLEKQQCESAVPLQECDSPFSDCK